MKALALLAAYMLAVASALGQGTVNMENYVRNVVDAPFFDDHGNRLDGTNYLAQLYAGKSADFLVPVGTTWPFITNGYFNATNGPFHFQSVTIPGGIVGIGGPAWVQVRAWEATGGATFEEAALAGSWTGTSGVLFLPQTGQSVLNPVPPVDLFGLEYPGNPIIVREPQNQRVRSGQSASLSVVAIGGITLFYQWYQGESGNTAQPVSGATNANYTTPPLTTNGTFWVNINSAVGSTNSTTATATVYIVRLDLRMISGFPALVIDGILDTPFRIEYIPVLNATNWIRLADISLYSSPVTLLDTTATNSATRFYRVVGP